MTTPDRRRAQRPTLRDRTLIDMLRHMAEEPVAGPEASPPDYADLACLLRAHREKAARVIDCHLAGDQEMARIYAKLCRVLEQQIESPRTWSTAARHERAWRRTERRMG